MDDDNEKRRFSFKEFSESLLEFRQKMGDKNFWAMSVDERQKVVNNIATIYIRNDAKDEDKDTMESLFASTMNEYTQREGFMAGQFMWRNR